ncbi:hypothetical protein [Facklamia miroungae]|uniref:Uncharacterized protein n=1 Tax=Facklamia miroungae TaxID=120956 RepID=A0A1G7NZW7_9LACT|nr:hypothetical protein [Facklamia miroungae]NKZ28505.1 hypothetical protein [Facklamia miroungae]SDF78730.1 hypothetical protein SAMN05421791_10145 [Facklamia miroungae]
MNSYLIAKVSNFKDDFKISPAEQLAFTDKQEVQVTEGDGKTSMVFETEFFKENKLIRNYIIDFDYKLNKKGKVFDRFFNYYYEPKQFNLYYLKNENIIIIRSQKDVAKEFLKELKEHYQHFDFDILNINIKEILSKVGELKSAWINVEKTGVNTESYHGIKVDDETDVIEAIDRNKATYVTFIYKFDKSEIYCGISKKGNIVLYDDQLAPENQLKLLIRIYNSLIK